MLNVSLNENVLTVKTPITKEVADKAFSSLVACDDDGNQVCMVSMSDCGCGAISSVGLTCNAVVDGCLAVVLVLPIGMTMDNVKKAYGKYIVEVNKYIDKINDDVKAEITAIDKIFAE